MASKLDNSTKMKLWVIFAIFIALIVGLLFVEVNSYFDIMEARKNLEQLRDFEMREMQKDYELNEGELNAADTISEPKPEETPANE